MAKWLYEGTTQMEHQHNPRAYGLMEMIGGGSSSPAARIAAIIVFAGTISLLVAPDHAKEEAARPALATASAMRPGDSPTAKSGDDCREAQTKTAIPIRP